MTLDEAQRRIVECMSDAERAEFERGCLIVDFYMDIATNAALPAQVRGMARDKLRDFAHRQPHQTVADIDGAARN